MHPLPKSRIGQGRARQRRKVQTHQPISLPHQSPNSANNKACSEDSNTIA